MMLVVNLKEDIMTTEQLIYEWVSMNYGQSEADNPSWHIKALAVYLDAIKSNMKEES